MKAQNRHQANPAAAEKMEIFNNNGKKELKLSVPSGQAGQVLNLLRSGAYSTIDLRDKGIYSPEQAVRKLRLTGYKIQSRPIEQRDEFGILRQGIALYYLESSPC